MLKSILKSLKNAEYVNSNKLIHQGMDYLIPNQKVYLLYVLWLNFVN